MAVSVADRVKILEGIIGDESVKASTRLRAIEELGRIEARAQQASAPSPDREDELAPDPMADLDEMELFRQRKARRQGA